MVVNSVDNRTEIGAASVELSQGKGKERPPSMEDMDQHLILTCDGGISHEPVKCNDCCTVHDHMRQSHASACYAKLRRLYIERNSLRVLQEEYN
jgi:hypothetical protein